MSFQKQPEPISFMQLQFVNYSVPIRFSPTKSEWSGGKPQGNIQLVSQYYFVRYSGKLIKSIKISNEESSNKAFILAQKTLYAYCKENSLLRNEYRYCDDLDGMYLEVTAGNTTFACDPESLPIVEEYIWRLISRKDIIFTEIEHETKTESIYFHRLIMGVHGKTCKVFHRDGNKLNNRKFNLIIEQLAPLS